MNFLEHYFIEKENVVYKLSSTQVNLNEEIADKVTDFSSKIPDEFIYEDPEDDSYGREDQIHVTALYGIHDELPEETKEVLKNVEPFEVTLGDISYFEADKYDVMKIEIESEALHNINKLLRDNVEYTNQYDEYIQHCTVAYVTKDFSRDSIDNETFNDLTQTITEVIFSSKNGKNYIIKLKEKE